MKFKEFLQLNEGDADHARDFPSISKSLLTKAMNNYSVIKNSSKLLYSGRNNMAEPYIIITPPARRKIHSNASYHNEIFDNHANLSDIAKRNADTIFMSSHKPKAANFTGAKGDVYVIIPLDEVTKYAVLNAPDFYYAFKDKLSSNLKNFNIALKHMIIQFLEDTDPARLAKLVAKANAMDKTKDVERKANWVGEKMLSSDHGLLKSILDSKKFAEYVTKDSTRKFFKTEAKTSAAGTPEYMSILDQFTKAYTESKLTPFEYIGNIIGQRDDYFIATSSFAEALSYADHDTNPDDKKINQGSEVWFNGRAIGVRLDKWDDFKKKIEALKPNKKK